MSSNFEEVRINDELIIYNTIGGPTFKTTVSAMNSGFEQRNSVWTYPRWSAELGDRLVKESEAINLHNFFMAMGGQQVGFRAKDWLDYKDGTKGILGTGYGDGALKVFQMIKNYPMGTKNRQRLIKKPVSGTVKVYKSGVLVTSGITIDHTTGIVTFTTAPSNGSILTWTGEFDIPVRFNTDKFEATFQSAECLGMDGSGAYKLGEKAFYMKALPVIEVRI